MQHLALVVSVHLIAPRIVVYKPVISAVRAQSQMNRLHNSEQVSRLALLHLAVVRVHPSGDVFRGAVQQERHKFAVPHRSPIPGPRAAVALNHQPSAAWPNVLQHHRYRVKLRRVEDGEDLGLFCILNSHFCLRSNRRSNPALKRDVLAMKLPACPLALR